MRLEGGRSSLEVKTLAPRSTVSGEGGRPPATVAPDLFPGGSWVRHETRSHCVDTAIVARDDIVLGIDLGTSFSTAAAWVNGKMYLVPDERGEPCIPTVVHYGDEGPPIVGHNAVLARQSDPVNTISGIKRLLGRKLDGPEGRVFAAGTAVKLRAAPNGRAILETRRGEHSAEEVASVVYQYIRGLAEKRFQAPVRRAVLTVPASATPVSTHATIRAAEQAGLQVLHTLHEPTAAAVAFGLDRFRGQRRVLVYDFGGGTFDVTIMRQQDSDLEPLAAFGDGGLGGDDFDEQLARHAAGVVWRKHRVELEKDVVRWDRVLREAEATKRALSAMEAARLRVREAFSSGGQRQDLDLTVARKDMQPRWQELVDRSLKTTAEVMVQAGLRPAGIETLVLIGGTTYIPMVRTAVTRMMSKPGAQSGDPQTSVACGAAVSAARSAARAA